MGWDYNGEKPLQEGGQRILWTSEWSWKVVVMKEFSNGRARKYTQVLSLYEQARRQCGQVIVSKPGNDQVKGKVTQNITALPALACIQRDSAGWEASWEVGVPAVSTKER